MEIKKYNEFLKESKDCEYCHGGKTILCHNCSGEEIVKCKKCKGKGKLDGKECPDCCGACEDICDVCNGDGVTVCPNCDSEEEIEESITNEETLELKNKYPGIGINKSCSKHENEKFMRELTENPEKRERIKNNIFKYLD